MAPTEEEVLSKLKPLREQAPNLSKKKLLARLNQENGWTVTSKDFRPIMATMEEEGRLRALEDAIRARESQDGDAATDGSHLLTDLMNASTLTSTDNGPAGSEGNTKDKPLQEWPISEENRLETAPELPQDALAAQVKYYEESTRTFILYGRGKYNYGITPNSDMQVKIELCKKRINDQWAKSRSKEAARPHLESRACWPVQDLFEFYRSGARKAGLDINDIVRQFKAEYGVNPLKGREPDSPQRVAREAQRARAYKKGKMKLLKLAAAFDPAMVRLDSMGEPLWDDGKHGEFVVIATRIDKSTGQEVGDVR